MGIGRIVAGCVTGIMALLFTVYVSFTVRGKGPILSNTYIFLSKEERQCADKKAEYKLISVVFGSLSAVFAMLSLNIFTHWTWTYVLMWVIIAFVVVYAIVNAVKTEQNRYTN